MKQEDNDRELQDLRSENQRLKSLLDAHGIPWNTARQEYSASKQESFTPNTDLSTEEKVALFGKLFAGREDVFALRWESRKGKSGYSPACGNEWKPGICEKPKIKCADCPNRHLLPMTDEVLFNHLSGIHTVGVYPLLSGDLCRFLAVDFDKQQWKDDALSFMETCVGLEIPAALEISRSGNGAHVWIFFRHPVPAREARRLGTALISRTCERKRQLELDSYDRFFPNQDVMPQGGFGNLIALPLQKIPRESGRSVFVDEKLHPYPDQWAFLSSLRTLTIDELEEAVRRTSGGHHPLDIPIVAPNTDDSEEEEAPWITPKPVSEKIPGPMPESLNIVLSNQIFIEKEPLPQPLMNRIIRLAAFANPEFYKAQAMRLPVWDKPRIIGCAENHPKHIGLPRGCLDDLKNLLDRQSIRIVIQEERSEGSPIKADFSGVGSQIIPAIPSMNLSL